MSLATSDLLKFSFSVSAISVFLSASPNASAQMPPVAPDISPKAATQSPIDTTEKPQNTGTSNAAPGNTAPGNTTQTAPAKACDMKPILASLSGSPPVGWDLSTPLSTFGLAALTEDNPPESLVALSIQTRDLLAEYQCIGIANVSYQRGQRRVIINAYRFASPFAAYGAYSMIRQGASTVVVRGDASSEDDQSISFWQGSYVIMLKTTATADEEAKEMMRVQAGKLSEAINEHADVSAFIYKLPVIDRVKGSEKVIMGPVAGRLVMPIPYISFLDLDKSKGALCAAYQFQWPRPSRLKLMIESFDDPQTALRVYQNYIFHLGSARREKAPAFVDMFKMNNQILLLRLSGPQISVIAGARDRDSAMMLSQQMLR